MQLLSETILWMLIIFIAVSIHFFIIEFLHKTPYHAVSFGIMVAIGVWMSSALYDDWYFFTVNTIYLGLQYWILFNFLLNFFRQKDDLLYLGKDSWLDRMEASMKSPGATLGLKIVLMICCAFILLDLPNPWE